MTRRTTYRYVQPRPVLLVDPSGWVPKHTDKLGTLGSQIVELALGNDCVKILTWNTFDNTLMYIPDDPRKEYTRDQLDEMFGNTLLATDLLTLHYDIFWHNRVATHRIAEVRFFNGTIECNTDLHHVNFVVSNPGESAKAYSLYCLVYGADTAGCEYCYFTV